MKKLFYAIIFGLGITGLASNRGYNSCGVPELKNEPFHTKIDIPKDGTIVEYIQCKTPSTYQLKPQIWESKVFAQNIKPAMINTLKLYK